MATAIHILSWINMIRNTWRVTVGTSIKHSGPTLLQNLTTFFVSHIVSFDYSDKDRLVTMVTGTICETHKIRAISLILWHQLWSHILHFAYVKVCWLCYDNKMMGEDLTNLPRGRQTWSLIGYRYGLWHMGFAFITAPYTWEKSCVCTIYCSVNFQAHFLDRPICSLFD